MNDIKMIECTRCKEDMPELRLTRFGYDFCINCSEEKPLQALSITGGDGDHTYNTIQVITSDQSDSIQRQKELNKNIKFGDAES